MKSILLVVFILAVGFWIFSSIQYLFVISGEHAYEETCGPFIRTCIGCGAVVLFGQLFILFNKA